MQVLIIGGNGFIGLHLTNYLVAQGQSVRVYSRSQNSYQNPLEQVEYIYGDLENQALLEKALKNVDIVYHLVSTTVPSTSNKNPIADVTSNLVGTINLLQSCVSASVRKVIFTSSGGTVYGIPSKLPIDETHATEPISSYGITKLAIEKYLNLFHHLYGLDYSIFRISNVYGPYQNPLGNLGSVTIFLNRILRNMPIEIWGDGEIVRDYVYIYDVVQALYLGQQANLAKKLFNIGSSQGISLNELLERIRLTIQRDFEVKYLESRKVDVPVNILDVRQAKTILNWQSTVSLKEGIEKTWHWLETYQHACCSCTGSFK